MTLSKTTSGVALTLIFAVVSAASASAASVTLSLDPSLSSGTGTIAAASLVISNEKACAHPDVAASVDPYATIPDFALYASSGESGTADVQVALSASGALQSASILHGSGYFGIDEGALFTARSIRYAPEMQGCHAVAGVYALTVTFTGD